MGKKLLLLVDHESTTFFNNGRLIWNNETLEVQVDH